MSRARVRVRVVGESFTDHTFEAPSRPIVPIFRLAASNRAIGDEATTDDSQPCYRPVPAKTEMHTPEWQALQLADRIWGPLHNGRRHTPDESVLLAGATPRAGLLFFLQRYVVDRNRFGYRLVILIDI